MRRLILWALAYLMLGAATTVASVVVLAAIEYPGALKRTASMTSTSGYGPGKHEVVAVSAFEGRAYCCYVGEEPMGEQFIFLQPDIPLESFVPPDVLACFRDFWASSTLAWDHLGLIEEKVVEVYGWPRPALYSISTVTFGDVTTSLISMTSVKETTGWAVSKWSHPRPFYPTPFSAVIPLRPMWGGFAIDSAAFAGIYALLSAPLWVTRIRRYRRAARGLCIWCGYDLKGAPSGACPECGKAALPVQTQEPPCAA
jgi:hypothetical protein